jgi:hypothetical protein
VNLYLVKMAGWETRVRAGSTITAAGRGLKALARAAKLKTTGPETRFNVTVRLVARNISKYGPLPPREQA